MKDEYKKLKREVNKAYDTIEHEVILAYDERYDYEAVRKSQKRSTSSINQDVFNRTPSQAFSTNYGSFCFTPKNQEIKTLSNPKARYPFSK
jgi:hypothetical protein